MANRLRPIARHVWETRYRLGEGERAVEDTWRRVAAAVAEAEPPARREAWRARFLATLADFGFLPGGRILAGAGSGREVTLSNCFVMGPIEDSGRGIAAALAEGAATLRQGGGIGCDFSTLRPGGVVAALHRWEAMCAQALPSGPRRGAMMATLRCDHPDIEAFIAAKSVPGALPHFNLSVLAGEDFLAAVRAGGDWPLVFPDADAGDGPHVPRRWSGATGERPCRVHRQLPARMLWRAIAAQAHAGAEPGVLFIDRINRENNLGWRERIEATNPCGEIPLPAYGACVLGSINLARFVREPFATGAWLDAAAIEARVADAVRFLDDAIDVSGYPLAAQREQARATRRIGLGVTGLADALAMLGLHYGSDAARAQAAALLRRLRDAAYAASIALAREKGPFPHFRAAPYLASPFVARLPDALRAGIARDGIRNSHLLAIAPTGSISLLAGNVSSGIEPIFALRHRRRLHGRDSGYAEVELDDYAYARWRESRGDAAPPDALVTAQSLEPMAHLAMQAALQPFVDNAIAKTVNLPAGCDVDAVQALFAEADRLGLKGLTVYRHDPHRDAILTASHLPCACGAPLGRTALRC